MKLLKLITTTALLSLGVTSIAMAGPKAEIKNGVSIFHTKSAAINCYEHNSDVCINNKSDETIYFTVPALNAYDDELDPPAWADVHSSYYYSNLGVTVVNSDGEVVFDQAVPNHSVIDIGNQFAANGVKTKKLVVRVHS